MTAQQITSRLWLGVLGVATVVLALAGSVHAAPIKEELTSRFGWQVDATSGANVCALASKDTCRPGQESALAGGFAYPQGVAVDSDPTSPDYGDVYVANTVNRRVQELTSAGAFVSMFGWDVNETKLDESAPQAERNVCTAASGDTCKAGVPGEVAEQFGDGVYSIAIDPASGDVYVQDYFKSHYELSPRKKKARSRRSR